MCMRHITCGLSSCTIFSTLSHKLRDFQKNVTEYKMCVLIFSTNLSETFLILKRTERDMIKMCIGLHVQYPYCPPCTVPLLPFTCSTLIALHVQYPYCPPCTVPLLPSMYSTLVALHVQYPCCPPCTVPLLPCMYSTLIALHVQYPYCPPLAVPLLPSTYSTLIALHVQ